jgi:uncharacterized membrane protein
MNYEDTTKEGWSEIDESIDIARPADELYEIWRDLESLPDILSHVKLVRVDSPRQSHWVVEGPVGSDVSWDSIITAEVPGKRLSWRSVPDSEVDNEGSVEFLAAPGSSFTEVRVRISYRPPAGKVGTVVAALFGKNPAGQVKDDLKKFKDSVEAGTFMRRSLR